MNRAERRAIARGFPKDQRRAVARSLKPPSPEKVAEMTERRLSAMGLQVVHAGDLLGGGVG